MGIKEVTLILEVVNARHGPEANLGEDWPAAEWHDHLVDPASLVSYLDYEEIGHPAGVPAADELEELRELAVAGRAVSTDEPARLAQRLEPILARYTFRLSPDGGLVPTSGGWRGFAAQAARGLVELGSQRERLSFCANPACDWLFLDESRNHSRQWCSMDSCGSRAKMARYRSRKRGGGAF
jgi:hypothetical protein